MTTEKALAARLIDARNYEVVNGRNTGAYWYEVHRELGDEVVASLEGTKPTMELAEKIKLAIEEIQSSIRYSPYDVTVQEAFVKLNEVRAALTTEADPT